MWDSRVRALNPAFLSPPHPGWAASRPRGAGRCCGWRSRRARRGGEGAEVVPLQDGGGGAVPVPGAARPPRRGSAGPLRLGAGPRRGAGDALWLPDRDGGGEEGEK